MEIVMTVVDEIRRNITLGRYSYHDGINVLQEISSLPYRRAKALIDEKPILKLIEEGAENA